MALKANLEKSLAVGRSPKPALSWHLWTLFSILFALIAACQLPSPESLRPRGVDFWAEGGRSDYPDPEFGRNSGGDWSLGIGVHFDLVYPDEE